MIYILQCGRIYKDAEICLLRLVEMAGIGTFNVAASIKMRKCLARASRALDDIAPSMWPHL